MILIKGALITSEFWLKNMGYCGVTNCFLMKLPKYMLFLEDNIRVQHTVFGGKIL